LTSTPTNAIQYHGKPGAACDENEAAGCGSELPLSFIGFANVRVKVGETNQQDIKETMMMENPYLNPFGAPIVIASADRTVATPPSILIVATYAVGTIRWTGAQVEGPITSGALGTGTSAASVKGMLTINSTQNEDLVGGTARETGTIAFTSMNPPSLDSKGTFSGNSTIPVAGEQDCSADLGFPSFPAGLGVCTQAGLNSVGKYAVSTLSGGREGDNAEGHHGDSLRLTIAGEYTTTWAVPALAFWATSTGNVTTTQQGDQPE
jgi:hypothetical protein